MASLRREVNFDYGRAASGTLRIFRDKQELEHSCAHAASLAQRGLHYAVLSQSQTVELEPSLQPIARELVGGIQYGLDEIGDAHRFCKELASHAQRAGVTFFFRTEVQALEARSGTISAALTNAQKMVADIYVVAAGSYSVPLLHHAGIHLPVQPIKGYSLTFAATVGNDIPKIAVVDDRLHAAIVPLDGALRVAGTAEFAGYDLTLRPHRVQNLVRLLQAVLPNARFDHSRSRPWCGLRPVSADGVPLVGATRIHNLFVNTGHGHLGWTLAAASGQLLSEIIEQSSHSVDPTPYDPRRFAWA